jgi:hypothetical protein
LRKQIEKSNKVVTIFLVIPAYYAIISTSNNRSCDMTNYRVIVQFYVAANNSAAALAATIDAIEPPEGSPIEEVKPLYIIDETGNEEQV